MAEKEDTVCVKRFGVSIEIPTCEAENGPERSAAEMDRKIAEVQAEMDDIGFENLISTVVAGVTSERFGEDRLVVALNGGD